MNTTRCISEGCIELILRSVSDGVVTADVQGRIEFLNPAAESLTGWSKQEARGQPLEEIFRIVDPETHQPAPSPIARVIEEGLEVDLPDRTLLVTRGGTERQIVGRCARLSEPTGAALSAVLVFRDAPTQQRQRHQLENEGLYRTLVDGSSDPIFSLTPDGHYLYVNQAFADGVNRPVGEIIGKTIWDAFPREEADRRFGALSRAFHSREEQVIEVRVPRADGDRFYLTTITPIKDRQGHVAIAICSSKDITQRKQAEEALRRREHDFSTLVENASDMIVRFDTDLRRVYCNPAVERQLGVPLHALLGKTAVESCPAEQAELIHRTLETVLATGEAQEGEQTYPTPFGIKHLHTRVVPERDSSGKLESLLAVTRDITERRRAEEALRESQKQYKTVSELMSDYVFRVTVDAEGGLALAFVTESFQLGTGRSLDEASSPDQWRKLMPPADLDTLLEFAQTIRSGQSGSVEIRSVRRGGHMRWVNVFARPEWDERRERVIAMVGAVQDITQRKQAEEALRESEEKFRALAEASPFSIFAYRDKFVYVNPAFESLIGYSAQELLDIHYWDLVHPEFRSSVQERGMARIQGDESPSHYETRLVRKDGAERWIDAATTVVLLGGEKTGIGILSDITERKRAEEERERLAAQLNQAQKMELVGRLAGGVAHDFNNMLQAMLGNLELVMHEVAPGSTLRERLEEVTTSAQRSAGLTRQLLAFARRQPVARKVVDLNDTILGMLEMLRRLIGEDIDLVWTPGAGLWPVEVDPSQIDQILTNLTVNARDAIAGVGKVAIETGNVTLDRQGAAEHAGAAAGDYVMLAVSDDGYGMDQHVLAHLFEPFFTTKGMDQGTGLGLATVYGITQQNGGFVAVQSEPGKGTTLKIYLPRLAGDGDAAQERAAEAAEFRPGGEETVLLVEDEPVILRLGKTMLERLGYVVLAAGTPGDAFRQAEAHAGVIHLLITDVVMPEMNGSELAAQISRLRPSMKCLFTSGYTANVVAYRGIPEDSIAFLQKPFSMQDLAAKVRSVLDQAPPKDGADPSPRR